VEGGVGKASRHTMDANISAYDLAQSYMVGYEIAIKGGALGIMCAYNMVNGKPSCANAELLETLRGDCKDGCHCLRSCRPCDPVCDSAYHRRVGRDLP